MITLSQSLDIPATTYDAVWLRSINISAMSTSSPVVASIVACPLNSQTGEISTNSKIIEIPNVMEAAVNSPYIAAVIQNIYLFAQDQIDSGSVSF